MGDNKVYVQTLVDRCKNGDFQAFHDLLEQYQSRIFSVCYGIVRNREDACDVMQEVFIKIYKSIRLFHGESSLYVWIYRIAVNASLDFLRKRKRKLKVKEKLASDFLLSGKGYCALSPEEHVVTLELKESIRKAIFKLAPKFKRVIVLREIEGLSYQEIAKICCCSVGTVMSRLFYARKKLIAMLRKEAVFDREDDEKK